MSSLRNARYLRLVGFCLLLIAACKPAELAERHSPPKTVLTPSKSAAGQPRLIAANDSVEDQTSQFIDQADIEDPIAFARRVVALSKGLPTQTLDSQTPEAQTPKGEDFGTNYDTTVPSDNQTVEELSFPPLEPQSTQQDQLMRALQEARMRDLEDRENAKWGAWNQQRLDYEDAMEEPPSPAQVTRFDLGLGLEIDHLVEAPPIRTTGRTSPLPEEEAEPRDCMFMNQVIGNQARPSRLLLFADYPTNNGRLPSITPPPREPPGCNDGRDNNANGLADRDDPVCWADRTNPSTYVEEYTESEPFNPFGTADTNSPSAAAPPFAPATPTPLQLAPAARVQISPPSSLQLSPSSVAPPALTVPSQ